MRMETRENTSAGEGEHQLNRRLSSRHLNMIAIGGAIGTGLLVASGSSIAKAGPGGALLAYGAIGMMVYLLMQSLGEMSTWLPSVGSFEEWAKRWVSPSFGFAQGWNYWFNWAITVAAELVAVGIVMKYWFPQVPSWIWSFIFLTLLFVINALTVRGFGESEFWFALIKVVTVIVFLAVGIAMIVGILGESPGAKNWTVGEAPFVGGFFGTFSIFMIAGFSFQGTEMVGIASGETKDPEKTIPKAIHAIFYRILLFYIGAILVIGFLLPYTDPHLLVEDIQDVAVSPFTLIFEKAGIVGSATIMNTVILTAILSAGNSGMYVSSRMLYALARNGSAPKIFGRVSRHGVPMNALIATTLIGAFAFLTSFIGDGVVYLWLLNVSGVAGFITWTGIAWCHYKFRKAFLAQGHHVSELPFKARFYPAGPLIALFMLIVVIVGQNHELLQGTSSVLTVLSSYMGLFFFLALWAGHKIVTRMPKIDPLTADLSRE
ncbi:amino acid permease [Actinotignum urinale]